jgi:hypothetical protein
MSNKEFYQGFAVACATLVRSYDEPSMAKYIMTSNGITLRDLKGAGVEEFDLAPLRKAMSR